MNSILLELVPDEGATFTVTVVLSGILIVFFVLLLLIAVFYAFGAIAPKLNNIGKNKKPKKKKEEPQQTQFAKNENVPAEKLVRAVPQQASPAPFVEEGISEEVVAAIAAAVAEVEGAGAVVRSVKRKNAPVRSSWANAAVIENTRPF